MDAKLSRTLEITVLSAENLKLDGKSVKKDTFVVVKVDSLNRGSTKADYEGGNNPSWNEKLVIDIPMHASFITLEVKCKIGSGNRVIGTSRVPVSDFLGDYTPDSYLHLLSYRLRDARGQKNGIINVSIKVKTPDYARSAAKKNSQEYSCSPSSQPPLGLPVGENNYYGGVVTGIPVWCASRA